MTWSTLSHDHRHLHAGAVVHEAGRAATAETTRTGGRSNYNTNASVTFDLGAAKPVNTFVLDVFAQYDTRNAQGYSIQVSTDNVNYTTVITGNNPDSEGSSYKYTLAAPVTARYVRLNL